MNQDFDIHILKNALYDAASAIKELKEGVEIFSKLHEVDLVTEADLKSEEILINAITKGTDAQAEVSVRLKEYDISVSGTASDTDTMVASAKAYIIALNKLIIKRKKRNIDLNLVTNKLIK